MDVREQISAYLEDPETLYKEWYMEQTQYETGIGIGEITKAGEPVGTFEDWKQAFLNWVAKHKSDLRNVICPNIDKIKAAVTKVGMVLEIVDFIEQEPYVGTVKTSATLLLLYGIEKLCEDYEA